MRCFVSRLIISAGQELLRQFYLFNRDQVRYKSKHQIVTRADIIAEKIIISAINKKYPTHQILSEEAGLSKQTSEYLWIIDPLDGTTNFALKNPLFGISIALAKKGQIIFGAIYIPFINKLVLAELGQGATINGKKIHVSKKKNLNGAFLTYCHGSKLNDVKRAIAVYKGLKIKYSDVRQMGSSVVEMAWVAAGYTDGHFVPGANLWDVAAGSLIIREAGGRVTDLQNHPWDLKSKDLIASNGQVHNQLLKEIRKYDL
ncbi:MAG: inositol monophosphatase family protein [Patescibacteria group bacterium]